MRLLTLIFLFSCSYWGWAKIPQVKCKVYQEFVSEQATQTSQTIINLNSKKKKDLTYLKTVISNLETEITVDDEVAIVLKNGLGSQQGVLTFSEKKKWASQTFNYPSDNPQGIRNKVKIECLKIR